MRYSPLDGKLSLVLGSLKDVEADVDGILVSYVLSSDFRMFVVSEKAHRLNFYLNAFHNLTLSLYAGNLHYRCLQAILRLKSDNNVSCKNDDFDSRHTNINHQQFDL